MAWMASPVDHPAITSRRVGSMTQVIGLFSATTRNQPDMRAVGKNAALMKIPTNTSGKVAATASWDPVLIASTWPTPPMARTRRAATAMMTSTAAGPPFTSAPKARKTATRIAA